MMAFDPSRSILRQQSVAAVFQNFDHDITNIREEMSFTSHSTPSTSPSPVTALHAITVQCLPLIDSSFSCNASSISCNDMAPGRSCLFANINKDAPASFW